MDKETRNAIDRATQKARRLLEDDFAAQLEGDFDVLASGAIGAKASKHLKPRQVFARDKVIAAIEHKRASGLDAAAAVADYLRDAAFTTLNRFAALKMLEARGLVQTCVTKGELSGGYVEYCGMAPGVKLLPDGQGYRLYLECIFDELSTEVKVLFDRRDPASALWPKRATLLALLDLLNGDELVKKDAKGEVIGSVWQEDETIGWIYQYFNGSDERKKMREESQAPRNSRELAVRNQFFTPRYVVQFLTDNTLGRIWYEMRGGDTALKDRCEYLVRKPDETWAPRAKKDPRDLKVLDPACGSGHFLLYAFDVLATIYAEGWADEDAPKSEVTGRRLRDDYATEAELKKAMPALVLAHNLHGVDIDARCAQIAQLALWMRAQKAYLDGGGGARGAPDHPPLEHRGGGAAGRRRRDGEGLRRGAGRRRAGQGVRQPGGVVEASRRLGLALARGEADRSRPGEGADRRAVRAAGGEDSRDAGEVRRRGRGGRRDAEKAVRRGRRARDGIAGDRGEEVRHRADESAVWGADGGREEVAQHSPEELR
jgi:hypothetical protein